MSIADPPGATVSRENYREALEEIRYLGANWGRLDAENSFNTSRNLRNCLEFFEVFPIDHERFASFPKEMRLRAYAIFTRAYRMAYLATAIRLYGKRIELPRLFIPRM